jgi:site-specific DNA-methyltransferase (adenine-specific)
MYEIKDIINKVIMGDCLEVMKGIPDKSVDMILADLPYGTTACKWDTIIPFEPLWEQYKRIIKDNGAIVLTASQPFTSALVMSNTDMFRYEIIWEKERPTNIFFLKKQIAKYHENICVFYKKQPIYNPQMEKRQGNHSQKEKEYDLKKCDNNGSKTHIGQVYAYSKNYNPELIYPKSILKINRDRQKDAHPTQKPVSLFEYLIKTYTNEGDLVLDNCIGSGTTAIAAINTGRNFIGIEMDNGYYEIANKRIHRHYK